METKKTKTEQSEILSLAQAVKRIPTFGGKRPHVATLYRWWSRGINGVHLECLKIGARLAVTPEALDKFFREAALAGPQRRPRRPRTAGDLATSRQTKPRTERQREEAICKAKEYLCRNGAL
ncbi:MAG TPA: DUF1580 domain-containing protein [Candidatus Hydrogenedentes bacterium]|nr:DUF1580 domain-containing protein [Candidatus Hydrogenedentota bacterium]HOV74833.1 DUF1580 domain-containing protein [Candidatus Hydrogenedentota bacterium]